MLSLDFINKIEIAEELLHKTRMACPVSCNKNIS